MYQPLQPNEIAQADPSQAKRLGTLLVGLGVLLLPLLVMAGAPQALGLHAAIACAVLLVGVGLRYGARRIQDEAKRTSRQALRKCSEEI
jgi:uncharacterized membrane protein